MQKSHAIGLETKVIERQHRFNAVEPDIAVLGRQTGALAEDVFRAAANNFTMKWSEVEGVESAAWWSPKPASLGVPSADLAVLREAVAAEEITKVSNAWTGGVLDCSHNACVLFKSATFPEEEWYLPLHAYTDSGVLAWKVRVQTAGAGQPFAFSYLEFDFSARRPVVLPILDVSELKGFSFEWRSWLWQLRHHQVACTALAPAVRAVRIDNVAEPIIVLAARNAFWALDAGFIRRICAAAGFAIPGASSTSLFDVLLTVVKLVLQVSEASALAICHLRLVSLRRKSGYSKQLLQIDKVARRLDSHDQKLVKEHQEDARKAEGALSNFKQEYKTARGKLPPEALASLPGASGKKPKAGAKKPAIVRQMPKVSEIPHSEIKHWLPPKGFVWKANRTGEWVGRCPPNSSCSRSWAK